MSTLFLITARGGSKGVPGKNLREIGGVSLIAWKARAARECDPQCRLVISTDSEEIALEAKRHGVDVPFKRPDELATDTASSASVIKHALDQLAANGENYDQVFLLEPSAPFTRGEHMKDALRLMYEKEADLIIGMKETQPHSVFVGERQDDDSISGIILSMFVRGKNLRRQDLKQEWTANGALYLFKTEMFLRTESIYGSAYSYGVLMDKWSSIEIDSPEDLEMAEYAFSRGYVQLPPGADPYD